MSKRYEYFTAMGNEGEKVLDSFLIRNKCKPAPVSLENQYLGIDRIVTDPQGNRYSFEYKTDYKAGKTGNFFIEISTGKVPGWALTSCAQKIIIYVPASNTAYMADTLKIRQAVKAWQGKFPTKEANNGSVNSRGCIVPIQEFVKDVNPKKYHIREGV